MVIPESTQKFMTDKPVIALATCDKEGKPNVAPMLQYWWYDENTLVIGDFFMKMTRKNIEENGMASFCCWDGETREAYKFTGPARYATKGPEFDMANNKMREKKPDKNYKGVVIITITHIYDMKSGPTAGNLISKS
ncbi:pyridoxamine 5'-phosphate oxidase family protein [Planctomycetota bacterium]